MQNNQEVLLGFECNCCYCHMTIVIETKELARALMIASCYHENHKQEKGCRLPKGFINFDYKSTNLLAPESGVVG